jgi:hypothetical protein
VKKKLLVFIGLALLGGSILCAQDVGLLKMLYGEKSSNQYIYDIEKTSSNQPSGNDVELYVNKALRTILKGIPALKDYDGPFFDRDTKTIDFTDELYKVLQLPVKKAPQKIQCYTFIQKASIPSESVKIPMIVDSSSADGLRTSPLLVTGPCFLREEQIAGGGVILIACDPFSSIPGQSWQIIPLNNDPALLNKLQSGFITGRAGFYPEKGIRRFFFELYAWPVDPAMLGG